MAGAPYQSCKLTRSHHLLEHVMILDSACVCVCVWGVNLLQLAKLTVASLRLISG